jgi:conjugation transfer TcpE-like protein
LTDTLVVRSYRRVFRFDRRIYRIDRFAIPVPGGLPLVGLLWFLGALLGVLVASHLPAVGSLLTMLSPPLRYLVLPAALAVLATQLAPDGRSAPRFAQTWLRQQLRARRRSAGRRVPRESERALAPSALRVRPDQHGTDLRRARVRGPARVSFLDDVYVIPKLRRTTLVRPATGVAGRGSRGRVVRELELEPGERLEVRP